MTFITMASQEEIRKVSIFINGTAADMTLKELSAGSNKLTAELGRLTIGTDAYNKKLLEVGKARSVLADVREDINKVTEAMSKKGFFEDWKNGFEEIKHIAEGVTIGTILSMGIRSAIEGIKDFSKELLKVAIEADGVGMAFSKIGNTEGLIERLRESSRGLISDLDLEKIAVKANNANIPISKLGTLLAFAQQRAKDTGQDVTELSNKLIEGLGKNSVKAVQDLGLDMKEVKEEFKKTGDMTEALSTIIKREMDASGQAVEQLGDKVGKTKTSWANFVEGLGKVWKFIVAPEQANAENVAEMVNQEMKQFGELEKLKDDQLSVKIKNEQARVKKLGEANKKAEAETHNNQVGESLVDFQKKVDAVKRSGEAYQAAQNALAALHHEENRRANKTGRNDGTVDGIDEVISRLKQQQKELSKTSVEWKKYQDQIDKLEKQKIAITGKDPAGDAARRKEEEAAKRRQAFMEQSKAISEKIKEFNASELTSTMSKNDKEIESTKNKYDKEIAAAQAFIDKNKNNKDASPAELKKHQDEIAKLKIGKDKEVGEILLKQNRELSDAINKIQEEDNVRSGTELDKKIASINSKYDALIKNLAKGDYTSLIAITAARYADIANAELEEKKKLIQEKERLDDQYDEITDNKAVSGIAKINKKYDDELRALKKSYEGKLTATKEFKDAEAAIKRNKDAEIAKFEKDQEKIEFNAAIQAVQDISNAEFTISANNRHAETDAKIKQLNDQMTAELANTNLTAAQQQAIKDKYAKQEADLKLQAWEADQAASEEQAVINGALAITKTFADYGFTPAGWIAAGAQAIATAAQIAVIADAKPPQFADGGYSAVDYSIPQGFVNRPTLFKGSQSGRPFVAGEGNKTEYIVSSEQLKDPVVADFVKTMESYRGVRRFESGGYSNAQPRQAAGSVSKPAPAQSSSDMQALLAEVQLLRQSIRDQEVYINYKTFTSEMDKIARIKTNANAKR